MLAGIAMWRETGDPQYIALVLNHLTPTLSKLGRFEEAKALMQESIALMLARLIVDHPSSEHETRSRARELFEVLGPAFSPDQVTAARSEAQRKTLDSIVAEVFEKRA